MSAVAATTGTVDELLQRVEMIAPIIGGHSAEADRVRSLSRPVVEAMLDAELYKMSRPRAFGGLEADPIDASGGCSSRPRTRSCARPRR